MQPARVLIVDVSAASCAMLTHNAAVDVLCRPVREAARRRLAVPAERLGKAA